jgi:hypothetical protein
MFNWKSLIMCNMFSILTITKTPSKAISNIVDKADVKSKDDII